VAVSLLLSEGHRYANRYALAKVWYEAQIIRERINQRIATEVTLMHSAMVAIMSPKGKGVTNLNKQLKAMRDGN
jgi:tRNA isopentenyl-2-thiomethyl-A-37 hydroxylase MiaE